MKNLILFISLSVIILTSCNSNTEEELIYPIPEIKTFYKGMDLSFQMELESYNLPYKDKNNNPIWCKMVDYDFNQN